MNSSQKPDTEEFIDRWKSSGGLERANYQFNNIVGKEKKETLTSLPDIWMS